MPDLQNFAMIRGSGRSVLLPRYDITFRVTDSNTGAVLHDHTGASGLLFHDLMLTLTEEQQQNLVERALAFWLENSGEM